MLKTLFDINREIAQISALSWSKVNKYEYLIHKETLPTDQGQLIQQTKFAYFPYFLYFHIKIINN